MTPESWWTIHACRSRPANSRSSGTCERTLGCYPLTGAIDSQATNLEAILAEMHVATVSERQGRLIDSDATASLEKKKREGYF